MKNFKANTIPELRKFKEIKISEIEKIVHKQTYYNLIQGKTVPTQKIIDRFCKLFEIDEKTFNRLLKNTIKTFNS